MLNAQLWGESTSSSASTQCGETRTFRIFLTLLSSTCQRHENAAESAEIGVQQIWQTAATEPGAQTQPIHPFVWPTTHPLLPLQ